MQTFQEFLNESKINEGFKESIKSLYDVISGKRRAERIRLEKEEVEQRKKDLESWKEKFLSVVKDGTKKYDVLTISYKYSDFSKEHWYDYNSCYESFKLIFLCDDNTVENAIDSYDSNDYWAWLNTSNDSAKKANGFKIIFTPVYERGSLSAFSFKEGDNRAAMICLFDCEDIRLNDNQDIDEIIDILKNKPRNFFGGNLEGIISKLEQKKQ